MGLMDMLNLKCRILRFSGEQVDDYGTPVPPRLDQWGTPIPGVGAEPGEGSEATGIECVAEDVPCALSRRTVAISPEAGRSVLVEAPRLYMSAYVDLREGDMVDITGTGRFRCGKPYRPRNHHIEVEVEAESEV